MFVLGYLLIIDVILISDGNTLAVGSRDNIIYLYTVSEGYRKYTRCGKCTVSNRIDKTVWSNHWKKQYTQLSHVEDKTRYG